MALKREMLEGLTEDKINEIMGEYGKAVQAGNRAAELQKQLDQLTKDLAAAQKTAGDSDTLRQELTKAQAALAATQKTAAIRDALGAYKPKDAAMLARLIDSDKVSIADDGTLIGLKEQVDPLKTSAAYLFSDTPDDKGGNPNPSGGGDGFNMNSFLRGE